MDKVYVLTEAEIRVLKDIVTRVRSEPQNIRQRPTALQEEITAPEVYLAESLSGIPAYLPDALTGTGDVVDVSSSTCRVYKRVGEDITYAGFTKTVYNYTASAVPAGTLFLTARDKFGTWFAVEGASSGSSGVITDRGVTGTVADSTDDSGNSQQMGDGEKVFDLIGLNFYAMPTGSTEAPARTGWVGSTIVPVAAGPVAPFTDQSGLPVLVSGADVVASCVFVTNSYPLGFGPNTPGISSFMAGFTCNTTTGNGTNIYVDGTLEPMASLYEALIVTFGPPLGDTACFSVWDSSNGVAYRGMYGTLGDGTVVKGGICVQPGTAGMTGTFGG